MTFSFSHQRGGLIGLAVTCAALALPAAALAHGKPASHPGKAVGGAKSQRCKHAKGKGALARCLDGSPVKAGPGKHQGGSDASTPGDDQNDGSTTSTDDAQGDDQNDDTASSDDGQDDDAVVDPTS